MRYKISVTDISLNCVPSVQHLNTGDSICCLKYLNQERGEIYTHQDLGIPMHTQLLLIESGNFWSGVGEKWLLHLSDNQFCWLPCHLQYLLCKPATTYYVKVVCLLLQKICQETFAFQRISKRLLHSELQIFCTFNYQFCALNISVYQQSKFLHIWG
jgi:hypothetical protein